MIIQPVHLRYSIFVGGNLNPMQSDNKPTIIVLFPRSASSTYKRFREHKKLLGVWARQHLGGRWLNGGNKVVGVLTELEGYDELAIMCWHARMQDAGIAQSSYVPAGFEHIAWRRLRDDNSVAF